MRPTKKRYAKLVSVWSISVIVSSLFLLSCGKPAVNIDDPFYRKSALIDIQKALTVGNCGGALSIVTPLYQSKYSDNQIRMLFAAAHACSMGIKFYTLLDSIAVANWSSVDQVFKSLVMLFPSRTTLDSRLQSAWLVQDALQATLIPGAVVGSHDSINSTSFNPGSTLARDRTDDANSYLLFMSMALVGTSLNRYGYADADDPVSLGYAQAVTLPWTSVALVNQDTTDAGCALASAMLNMLDAIDAVSDTLPTNVAAALTSVTGLLQSVVVTGANTKCTVDGYSANQCSAAVDRLRFRGACDEQDPSSSGAAGIITGINSGWL